MSNCKRCGEALLGDGDFCTDCREELVDQAADLFLVVDRLAHMSYRLRLRSPATQTEKRLWAELRDEARELRLVKIGRQV